MSTTPPVDVRALANDVIVQLDSAAGEAYEEGSVQLGDRITDVLIPLVARSFGMEETLTEW